MNKLIKALFCALAAIAVTNVHAQKGQGVSGPISLTQNTSAPSPLGASDSSVTLHITSMGIVSSWDGFGDASNVTADCVTGTAVTGFEWSNVTVRSVDPSWLSEAAFAVTNTAATNGITGNSFSDFNDNFPGVSTYSLGLFDLTDNSFSDVIPGVDGLFRIEFHETFDDFPDGVDAILSTGTLTLHGIGLAFAPGPACPLGITPFVPTQVVPTLQWYGLFALAFGVLLIVRRSLRA